LSFFFQINTSAKLDVELNSKYLEYRLTFTHNFLTTANASYQTVLMLADLIHQTVNM